MENSERKIHLDQEETEKFISQKIIVKIGSSTITGGREALDTAFISDIARQISYLKKKNLNVAIVSSGAVACGKHRVSNYDGSILSRQRAAARGQRILIQKWADAFETYGMEVDQILINDDNFPSAKNLLNSLLADPVGIPIINANDAVSDHEMKQLLISADNDRLAGFVAGAVGADTVFLLSDVDGIKDREGNIVPTIYTHNYSGENIIFRGRSETGTGGMESKHQVAMELAEQNMRVVIGNGREENILIRGAKGESVGTLYFAPSSTLQ